MSHTIHMAYAGLRSRTRALEVLTNNIANAGSAGFKQQRAFFSMVQGLKDEQSQLARSINGPVVRVHSGTDFNMGSLVETGNTLDLAVTGEGFFAVETAEGVRYTRNGSFRVNENRELVTTFGQPVLSAEGEEIVLPEGEIEISAGGQVSVNGVISGQLKLVSFDDLSQLTPAGGSFFVAAEGEPEVMPEGSEVIQGYLEQANVNPVTGMTEVIDLMRSFEMLTQVIRSLSKDVDQKVINEIGQF